MAGSEIVGAGSGTGEDRGGGVGPGTCSRTGQSRGGVVGPGSRTGSRTGKVTGIDREQEGRETVKVTVLAVGAF